MEVDSEIEDKSGLHFRSSQNDDNTYVLHAVLVHSGDNHGGHYVVFVNPNCDGKWCKFDDDVVSRYVINFSFLGNNFGASLYKCANQHVILYNTRFLLGALPRRQFKIILVVLIVMMIIQIQIR